MKISKTLLGAIALLGMTGIASAQTKIYLTGATSFRAIINNQIDTLLGYPGNSSVTKASDNATFTSANAITWTGGTIGGTPVTIKVSYSGAAAGIQEVAGAPNFPVNFLPDGATGTSNTTPTTSGAPHESAVPDIVTSIVYQGTTPFNGTFQGVTYAKLVDNVVAVSAFTFAGSKGFPTGQSVTPQIAQTLFPAGVVPLSEFTGNDGDLNTGVIATGRNADGGTRLNVMAETNVGVNTTLSQYKPTISSGTVTGLALYPASTINGISYTQGDGGESSDSTLRTFLPNVVSPAAAQQVDPTLTGGYLVTYIGVSDFNAVSGSGAVALNYNGVPESQTGIIEGSYTLWGYAHIDYRSTLGNGSTGGPAVKLTFATDLANQIYNSTTSTLSPNVSVPDMKVQRFGDGGTVSSLFH
jgi:hypothetical protein